MMTDPIADMLTRIRNGSQVGKTEVTMPYSGIKHAIAGVLVEAGYVAAAEKVGSDHPELRIGLKYKGKNAAFRSLKRISRPGRRSYSGYQDLPRVLSDRGIAVVSTPQGVMSNKEARRRKLGGEIICEVY
ncbi:30S ribosomal protein S8 [Candidatus Uhrbacteria bacterium]|nr:30S ribosomal protein S8 [Candidatus Uhrbacteria bacterium]